MLNFFLGRAARILLILVSVQLLVFLLIHAVPGSPWDPSTINLQAMSNLAVSDTTLAYRARYFGLDQPLWRQFTRYMVGDVYEDGNFVCGLVCGNMGPSIRHVGRDVKDVLFRPPKGHGFWDSRFGYSIRLISLSFAVVTLMGIPLGVAAAYWARSRFDQLLSTVLTSVSSIPIFILGLLGIILFASGLKWINVLPHWDEPKYWVLPTILLAAVPLANLVRIARAAMLNAMSGEYIRTARAKGLTRAQTMWRHILPNALITILTYLLPVFVELLAASFIIEGVFSFPGFGYEYWNSIISHDFALIMGITFLYACGFALANLVLETVARSLDPRMRVA
jgi:ABC-type dipeptide/oligopeptide/nickel transport system permease component